MSKRARGQVRTHRRPGARPPTSRTGAVPRRAPVEPSQLEEAEIVAEEVVEDRPAAAAAELERGAGRGGHARARAKAGSLLAAKAASEYVYVAADMRRILVVAGLLFGTLIVLWILLVVMRVIPLPFY